VEPKESWRFITDSDAGLLLSADCIRKSADHAGQLDGSALIVAGFFTARFPSLLRPPKMSLEAAPRTVMEEVPAPGLSSAFKLFTFIASSVQAAQESKKQFQVLAKGVGELLSTLNAEFRGSRIVAADCVKPLADLEKWAFQLFGSVSSYYQPKPAARYSSIHSEGARKAFSQVALEQGLTDQQDRIILSTDGTYCWCIPCEFYRTLLPLA
jgi:hypothetical protein